MELQQEKEKQIKAWQGLQTLSSNDTKPVLVWEIVLEVGFDGSIGGRRSVSSRRNLNNGDYDGDADEGDNDQAQEEQEPCTLTCSLQGTADRYPTRSQLVAEVKSALRAHYARAAAAHTSPTTRPLTPPASCCTGALTMPYTALAAVSCAPGDKSFRAMIV